MGELLYESVRTRVWREHPLGGAGGVIRKRVRGVDSGKRISHETATLRRLAGVVGVARLAGPGVDGDEMLLVDGGGRALRGLATPVDMGWLLRVGRELATTLAGVHRLGVVHGDVNPANIVVDGSGRVELIDFDLASTFAEERPQFRHATQIVGTLAYLAPEQTGRTGRPVDIRADLYGLGATLYELACGQPPFGHGDGDALALIHDHLARVPVPPAQRNPAVPEFLSRLIMRLLEKGPDRRYQSAEGLAHDLDRLCDALAAGRVPRMRLGQRDFPYRLAAPSRLVGRVGQIAALRDALAGAVDGQCPGVLVSGVSGVGKTALIDELRTMVTERGGWFVSGKFDQYRQDPAASAVRQALRGLGRLLLAEPEEALGALRPKLRAALGADAGLIAAILPEFAALLDMPADDSQGDPAQAQVRLQQSGVALLRAVCTPSRPLVMVIDDLQWAWSTPIGFVDAVLVESDLRGLLLVGAYRPAEVDAAHPLTAMLTRWTQLGCAPRRLHLDNLPPDDLAGLLAEMLRLAPARATRLAELIAPATGGNPYDTVEFVNALCRDGALVLGSVGWTWRAPAVRRYATGGDVLDLLTARIQALPAGARALVDAVACLGGDVETSLLAAAIGRPDGGIVEAIAPALEDGLLILDRGEHPALRFRHDRVQQAAYRRLDPPAAVRLHLALARRLARIPHLHTVAAEQYLPVIDSVTDQGERREVVVLFRTAASAARLISNHAAAERCLRAALALCDQDAPRRVELTIEHHTALYALGRFAELDQVYEWLCVHCPDPLARVDAVCAQVASLTGRMRVGEAIALGLDTLRQLGVPVPGRDELDAQTAAGLDRLYRWLADTDDAGDARRPVPVEPAVLAAARLITRILPPTYFSDHTLMGWLTTTAGRMWIEQGPAAALAGPLGYTGFVVDATRHDQAAGAAVVRRVLAVSDTLGYPEAGQVRFLHACGCGHWFHPLEDVVAQARRAHEELTRGGDLQYACFTHTVTLPMLLDCAPTLDRYAETVRQALAFTARTGNDHMGLALDHWRQLVCALRAETESPTGGRDAESDEQVRAPVPVDRGTAATMHVVRGLLALIMGDLAAVARHAAAAVPYMPHLAATYTTTRPYLLRGVALAEAARTATGQARAALLAEVAACRDWLTDRAEDAPANFAHLARLVTAEHAWASGDTAAAMAAFDTAIRYSAQACRPWHQALIRERAGLFHRAHGADTVSEHLLAQALHGYAAWGATAKVERMRTVYPFLTDETPAAVSPPTRRAIPTQEISHDTIDMVGVLRASQALSSETDMVRLHERVTEVLRTLTGATTVHLALREDATEAWTMPDDTPLDAFRYAQRTQTPHTIDDATYGSWLFVPILGHGTTRAMLILHNHLTHGAFTTNRLEAIRLITGQLTVSLDNALLYASLERKVAERTEALRHANQQLERLSATDALTGLANRRRMQEALDHEWRRAMRTKEPLAIAMIDIDHFKAYNDHHGHQDGDQCLRQVAHALRDSIRSTDLAARYGGEEFCLIMPAANIAGAHAVAQRARAAVAALELPHPTASAGRVTVSIGVASAIPGAYTPPENLVKAADTALYQAKHTGRDRIECAAQPELGDF